MTVSHAAPKKSLSVSRVILLLILVAGLGALGFDLVTRYRMGQLYDSLEKLTADAEDKSDQGISKEKVHEKLDRTPTRTSTNGSLETEEYDFPGVFYIHRLTVKYRTKIKMYEKHEKTSIFRIGSIGGE